MSEPSIASAETELDPRRRFVRVTGINSSGFVEFEFAIGFPELCVELALPPQAFQEFCVEQGVERLDAWDVPSAEPGSG